MNRLEELQELLLEMSNPKGYSLLKIDELMPKTVLHLCKLACCLDEDAEGLNRRKWTHEIKTWLVKIDNLSNIKTGNGRLTYKDYTERLQDRYTSKRILNSISDLIVDGYKMRNDYIINERLIQDEFISFVTSLVKEFFEEQFKLLEEDEWTAIKYTTYIDKFISLCYKKEDK